MLNTILVAVDDSPTAKFVIKALGQLQLQPTTNVIFCHVIPTVESDFDLVADRPRPSADEFPYGNLEKQLRVYQDQLDCETEIEKESVSGFYDPDDTEEQAGFIRIDGGFVFKDEDSDYEPSDTESDDEESLVDEYEDESEDEED